MKIYCEVTLNEFEFWCGATVLAEKLTNDELKQIEAYLEDLHPDGMTEEEVNDFFRFDGDTIAMLLGEKSETAILNRGCD